MKNHLNFFFFNKGFVQTIFYFRIFFAILLIIIISLVSYEYILLQTKPYRKIKVLGNQVLSNEVIQHVLEIPEHTSFWNLDSYSLTLRLLRLAWIQTVRVQKVPSLDLKVTLVEREPIAFLKTKDDLFLMDGEQIVLPIPKKRRSFNLPIITNQNLYQISSGKLPTNPSVQKAIELITLLKQQNLLPLENISEIIITDPLNIELITIKNQVRIQLGKDNFKQKLKNLYYTMPELKQLKKKIQSLDLRYKNKVIVS